MEKYQKERSEENKNKNLVSETCEGLVQVSNLHVSSPANEDPTCVMWQVANKPKNHVPCTSPAIATK